MLGEEGNHHRNCPYIVSVLCIPAIAIMLQITYGFDAFTAMGVVRYPVL
jgi:hypothetical protein